MTKLYNSGTNWGLVTVNALKRHTAPKIKGETLTEILSTELESSSSKTPEYKSVVRKAINRTRKILGPNFEVPMRSMPHFEFSVMIHNKVTDKWAHYFTGDLRWFGDTHVIRSAESNKDFRGGSNNQISRDEDLETNLINWVNKLTN